MIGIDKTILSNIQVEAIDINKFMAQPSNKRSIQYCNDTTGYPVINTVSHETILLDTLTIKDNGLFNSFKLNYKLSRGTKIYYTILELTVSDNDGNNLKPMPYEAYMLHLDNIKSYMKENYGITINVSEAKFKSIEINRTEQMNQQFQEYLPVIEACEQFMSNKRYSHKMTASDLRKQPSTVYFKNAQMTLKFYDKTKQLQELSIECKDNLLRIEYTLHGMGVARGLLTNKVSELSQETIEQFFSESIAIDIIAPFNKAIANSNKKISSLYKQYHKQFKRGAFTKFLNSRELDDILLDVSQIEPIAVAEFTGKNSTYYKKQVAQLPQNVFSLYHELVRKFL